MVATVKQNLKGMKNIWQGQNTNNNTKIRVPKGCVFHITLFECKAWTQRHTEIRRMHVFEVSSYRTEYFWTSHGSRG